MPSRRPLTCSGLIVAVTALGAAGPAAARSIVDPTAPHLHRVVRGAPAGPAATAPASGGSSRGFDWGDAAIGAGGTLGLTAACAALTFARPRRRDAFLAS
jgi:hypothetical protein